MNHQVLKLDISGIPERWITPEAAACYYATDAVAWSLGDEMTVLHGGTSRVTGMRSILAIHPIIAVRGSAPVNLLEVVPTLTNAKLFARDRHTCAYCGEQFPRGQLTRDHILPKARGGLDRWQSVVTACYGCNQAKGCRTPEEAGMPLIFLPYVPSVWEDLILSGRRILIDQRDFLAAKLPRNSRLRPH